MESEPRCRHCGSTDIDRDPSRGDAVCTSCGSVLEESIIVSEVQFAQDSHGASRAVGQLVTAEGNASLGFNLGHSYGLSKESRAVTLHNAKRKITDLARRLVLSDHCIDMAHNFYKMALTKRLTQGRKNTHIVAACVYLVCRQQETPHMLLDISDILQVNVYDLGRTYLKLQTELCINTPSIDPTLYILRFAHQLGFENKVQDVSLTASRLVQRMKRDWMHTGRRPSGLCGAALLVAARMHNFSRSVNDIIKVVKVGQATIRKRLIEFSDTPSSRLTLDQFMTIDLEEEQDPPAFKAARKKKGVELEENKMKEMEQEVYELQKEIEQALEKFNEKKLAKASSIFKDTSEQTKNDNTVFEEFITKSTFDTISELFEHDDNSNESSTIQDDIKEVVESVTTINDDEDSITNSDVITDSTKSFVSDNNELDLTGIDDGEIDTYLLSSNEIRSKSKYWFDINKNYLREQRIKQEKRVREEAENAKKEPKKKRQRHKREPMQAQTTGEAIEKILQQKKISLKLDYTVLKNLNAEKSTDDITKDVNKDNVNEGETKEKPVKKRASKVKPQPVIPSTIRAGISALVKKAHLKQASNKLSDDEEMDALLMHSEQLTKQSAALMDEAKIPTDNAIIIENHDDGPPQEIDYNSQDELDEDEEDEEIDHSQMSAAQLLGYSNSNREYEDYDYE